MEKLYDLLSERRRLKAELDWREASSSNPVVSGIELVQHQGALLPAAPPPPPPPPPPPEGEGAVVHHVNDVVVAAPVAPTAPAAPVPPARAGIELVQHQGALEGAVVHHVNDLVEVRMRMEPEGALLFVVGNKDIEREAAYGSANGSQSDSEFHSANDSQSETEAEAPAFVESYIKPKATSVKAMSGAAARYLSLRRPHHHRKLARSKEHEALQVEADADIRCKWI